MYIKMKIAQQLKLMRFAKMNISIIFIFAILYKFIDELTKDAFNSKGKMSMSESLYFATITHTTLGYGDVLPTNTYSRTLAVMQSFGMFALTASFAFN